MNDMLIDSDNAVTQGSSDIKLNGTHMKVTASPDTATITGL